MPEPAAWFEDSQQLGKQVDLLEQKSAGRRNRDDAYLREYYDESLNLYTPENVIDTWADGAGGSLIQELVDGAASMLVRSNSVKVTPVGADETLRHNCTQLELFISGVKQQMSWPVLAHQAFIDAGTSSAGFVKFAVNPQTEEIEGERQPSRRFLWDDDEGSKPLSLFWVGPVPKALVKLLYTEHAEAIQNAQSWREQPIPGVDCTYGMATTSIAPTIKVCEAWSRKVGSAPGKHVIAVLNDGGGVKVTLVEEDWDFDRFPVAVLRWMPAYKGFGGRPIAAISSKGDYEHRHWNTQLRKCLRGGMPIVQQQEQENLVGVSDDIQVWKYRTRPAEVFVPNTVNPEMVKRAEGVRTREFERNGISQQLAKGERPQGLNSDPAQRAWLDVVGTRLQPNQRLFDQFELDAARCILMLASKYKKTSTRVKAPGTTFLNTIKFADLKLKENQYSLELGLASDVEQTYAGKLARVADIQKVAPDKVPPAEMVRQLNNPDPAALERDINAPRDLAHSLVSLAIDKGILEIPDDDPEVRAAVLEIGRQRLNRALEMKYNGGPDQADAEAERRIQLLRVLIDVVTPPPGAEPPPAPVPEAAAPAPAPEMGAPAPGIPPPPPAPTAVA